MKLNPLFRYPGGQSREARRLEKFFPPHSTYVEPFVGGGSFFFRKEPSETEVIGDTSEWVIDFYDKARKGGLRKCQDGFKSSRSAFEKHKSSKSACGVLARQAMGYGPYGRSFSPALTGKTILKNKFKGGKLSQYEKRLRRAWLTTRSFEATMKKWDSPDTWHLLDPPWPDNETTKEYEGGLTVLPDKVANVCRKMKGTVWVLYGDTPDVRDAFSDFHIYKISTRAASDGKHNKAFTKLLITNDPIDGKPEGVSQLHGLGLTNGGAKLVGSLIAAGILVAVRSKNGDMTAKEIVGSMLVGSSVFWLLSTVAIAALED